MTDYSRFSCPNKDCKFFNQMSQNNIVHRSWMGKHKNIERLRCICCRRDFSSNKGTLRENTKITEQQQVLILKCFRWGVPETGVADIAEVNIKTVHLFQFKAAKHAESYHDQMVHNVNDRVAQCDELYAKKQGSTEWVGVAMAATSLLILSVFIGTRNQKMADSLLASVWTRCRSATMLLTDGWACYWNAFLRCFGEIFQPRRRNKIGRKKGKALRLPRNIFYAQVVKRAQKIGKRWRLNSVVIKALCGKLDDCKRFIKICSSGTTVNTSFIERFNASLRNCIGALRRKSRCSVKKSSSLSKKVWIFTTLYNWVIPHSSLSKGTYRVTPAMAAGLSSKPISYIEYIKTPMHIKSSGTNLEQELLKIMKSNAVVAAAKRYKRGEIEEETRWKEEELKEAI